jgi:hypothetical protein
MTRRRHLPIFGKISSVNALIPEGSVTYQSAVRNLDAFDSERWSGWATIRSICAF